MTITIEEAKNLKEGGHVYVDGSTEEYEILEVTTPAPGELKVRIIPKDGVPDEETFFTQAQLSLISLIPPKKAPEPKPPETKK